MKPVELAKKLGACGEAARFANGFDTVRAAWDACPRGDWMLWTAQRLGVGIRVLTLAKGLCASTVRHLMLDSRSVAAMDAALAFGRGEIGPEELADAAYAATCAAYAAADAADAAYAAACAAAYAAACAADAAYAAACAAAYVAACAADAAYVAACAADAADAAHSKSQVETANICREVLTDAVFALIEKLESPEGRKGE